MFDALGAWLKDAWKWFTDLIAPVKSTKETLDNCKMPGWSSVGHWLMLTAPLQLLMRWEGLDTILKNSASKVKRQILTSIRRKLTPTPTGRMGAGIPVGWLADGRLCTGYGRGGKSYVDNSVNNFHVGSQHPGGASAAETKRMLLDVVEERAAPRGATLKYGDGLRGYADDADSWAVCIPVADGAVSNAGALGRLSLAVKQPRRPAACAAISRRERGKITLSGVLLPEITGGKISMQLLDAMAAEGKAPLLEGTGTIYGMFVVNSVSETRTEFFSTGSARRIEFTLTLTRVDESFTAMYGDLQAQAEGMLGQVSELAAKAGNMAGGLLQ